MNLHIVDDEKFINNSIKTFEQYYQNQNIFIVQIAKGTINTKYVDKTKQTIFLSLTKRNILEFLLEIIDKNNVKNIFIHYLNPLKAYLVNEIVKRRSVKTYWIFYGADLYSVLNRKFGYNLFDKPEIATFRSKLEDSLNAMKFFILCKTGRYPAYSNFIKQLDYFCFWNYYDFQLLKKYFKTNAQFKEFAYFNNFFLDFQKNDTQVDKVILVNNSASTNGNHLTVLEKLKTLDGNNEIEKIIVPLSYGDCNVKNQVLKYGCENFNNKFVPLIDYLKKEDYFSIIGEVTIAVFGARRQEAAGNIFFLLHIGVKVFVREDNNMLAFLREKGFVIYSFENDLNSVKDLEALTDEEKLQNNKAYNDFYNQERKDFIMKNLITN